MTVAGADDPAAPLSVAVRDSGSRAGQSEDDSSPNCHPAIIYLLEHDLRAKRFAFVTNVIQHNFRDSDFIRTFSSQSGSAASVLIRSINFS
jgi:hypothetical protein